MGGGASRWTQEEVRGVDPWGQEAALFGELLLSRPGGPGAGWGWDKGERPARGVGRWDLCVSWGKVKEKLGSQRLTRAGDGWGVSRHR